MSIEKQSLCEVIPRVCAILLFTDCNLNGRKNNERTQVDTITNKITPGLNGA